MASDGAGAADVEMAQANFEFENDIKVVESADEIYRYDSAKAQQMEDEAPWRSNPKHFKKAHISALALLKMVMHARSGKSLEVMGVLQGKVDGDRMIVMDAFALPVEGTETRVNAGQAEYGYMCDYTEMVKKTGRLENVLGWYHSHPGYGCWLSGIDVGTQRMNQQYQDPWLAIVVDPVRTSSAGKVELGAFRCYPQGYTPEDAAPSEYQTVPPDKIEDFGVHASAYYSLEVSYFKSSLDAHLLRLLWNKYWVNTLSSSPLVANASFTAKQVADVASKVQKSRTDVSASRRFSAAMGKGKEQSEVQGAAHDASVASFSVMHGLMTQLIKHKVFNGEGPSA